MCVVVFLCVCVHKREKKLKYFTSFAFRRSVGLNLSVTSGACVPRIPDLISVTIFLVQCSHKRRENHSSLLLPKC